MVGEVHQRPDRRQLSLLGQAPQECLARRAVLCRIDAATNAIDRVLRPGATFGGGGDIVVAAGSVWVVDGYNNSVIRLPLAAFGP